MTDAQFQNVCTNPEAIPGKSGGGLRWVSGLCEAMVYSTAVFLGLGEKGTWQSLMEEAL